jgi:hypothetical protein
MEFKGINNIDDLVRNAGIGQRETRFRVSIYFDVNVPETGDIEADRARATAIAEAATRILSQHSDENTPISNPYVGGVKNNPFGSMGGELNDKDW